MKKLCISIITTLSFYFSLQAQTIPVGTCAIRFTYDGNGNRTQRDFYCNNGLIANTSSENNNASYQVIEALYPNPTTGKFKVIFSNKLDNATVKITNAQGAVIQQKIFTGNVGDFDLSQQAAGVYFIVIYDGKNTTSFKVVKE